MKNKLWKLIRFFFLLRILKSWDFLAKFYTTVYSGKICGQGVKNRCTNWIHDTFYESHFETLQRAFNAFCLLMPWKRKLYARFHVLQKHDHTWKGDLKNKLYYALENHDLFNDDIKSWVFSAWIWYFCFLIQSSTKEGKISNFNSKFHLNSLCQAPSPKAAHIPSQWILALGFWQHCGCQVSLARCRWPTRLEINAGLRPHLKSCSGAFYLVL